MREEGSKLLRGGLLLSVILIVIGAIVAVGATVIISWRTWQRGIYAGYHYKNARHHASSILIEKFGAVRSQQFRYVGEAKEHLIGGEQVRILQFVNPRGIYYCVSVWGGKGYDSSTVERGCRLPAEKVGH